MHDLHHWAMDESLTTLLGILQASAVCMHLNCSIVKSTQLFDLIHIIFHLSFKGDKNFYYLVTCTFSSVFGPGDPHSRLSVWTFLTRQLSLLVLVHPSLAPHTPLHHPVVVRPHAARNYNHSTQDNNTHSSTSPRCTQLQPPQYTG